MIEQSVAALWDKKEEEEKMDEEQVLTGRGRQHWYAW